MEDYAYDPEDEAFEDTPLCPYCGEPSNCHHVLVLLDRTCNECLEGDTDGIDNLRSYLEQRLLDYLRAGLSYPGNDKNLLQLWQYAAGNHTADDESADTDPGIFYNWLLEQALLHGAAVEDIEDVSGMGYSARMYLVFAEDPDDLLQEMEAYLDDELPEPGKEAG